MATAHARSVSLRRRLTRTAAWILVLCVCVACPSPGGPRGPGNSGGGGGGGGPTSSVLYLDAPTAVEAGEAFAGEVRAAASGGVMPTDFVLAQGPDGMTIDATTGAVGWIPTAAQRGPNPVAITADLGGSQERVEAVVFVEVFDVVVRQRITAASGGVVQVRDTSSPMAGTAIHFPAGALEGDAEIVVRVNAAPSQYLTSFFVVDLGPSQVFRAPVRLELGYSDAWLTAAGVANEAGLRIVYQNPESGAWEPVPCVPDPAGNRVIAQITHFSPYALIVDSIDDLTSWASSSLLSLLAELRDVVGDAVDSVVGAVNTLRTLAQPRQFVVIEGGLEVRNTDRIALLLHGVLSSSAHLVRLRVYARERYDHVYFYEYPSGLPIRANGAALADMILRDAGKFPDGAAVDVYTHSMGGLVFRSALEDSKAAMMMSGVHWNHVVFLGTPHRGADVQRIQRLHDLLYQRRYLTTGINDLRPGSAFLEALRELPGQGWTRYSAIAGMIPPNLDTDGWVEVASAIPLGEFRYADHHQVLAEHSELHTHMLHNGVAAKLDQWLAPQHQGPRGETPPVEVTQRIEKAPVVNGRHEWVETTATIEFAPWVPLPPFLIVLGKWERDEVSLTDQRWLLPDMEDYAFLRFAPDQFTWLESQGKVIRGLHEPRRFTMSVRETDVPEGAEALEMTLRVQHMFGRNSTRGGQLFEMEYGPF